MNKILSLILISLFMLSACGQSGSLYIPGTPADEASEAVETEVAEEEEATESSATTTE